MSPRHRLDPRGAINSNRLRKSAYNKEWGRKNKDRKDALNVKHRLLKYGLTPEHHRELMLKQDGKCLICGAEHWSNLFVDHNHQTGKVRGLICCACNAGIGMLQDSIDIVESALEYLRNVRSPSQDRTMTPPDTPRLPVNAESGYTSETETSAAVCLCGGDIPYTRPSGMVICQVCGRPWRIVKRESPRP